MSRHEIRLVTEWGNGTEKNWLECFSDGCGWKIPTNEADHAGAQRAAREHTELHATIKAKHENDERFMLERDEARRECDRLRHEAKLQRSDLVQWVRDYERARTRINELTVMNEAMSKDVAFLGALEAAGVDNWEGYEIAQEMMEEESEQ